MLVALLPIYPTCERQVLPCGKMNFSLTQAETAKGMNNVILAGVIVTALGLIGLIYCIGKAFAAKRSGVEGEELNARLQGLVAINMGAFLLSAIGLALVLVGTLL